MLLPAMSCQFRPGYYPDSCLLTFATEAKKTDGSVEGRQYLRARKLNEFKRTGILAAFKEDTAAFSSRRSIGLSAWSATIDQ